MYRAVSTKPDFAGQEEDVLLFWKEHDVFQQSMKDRRSGPEFVFYDGPPFATGLPHYGHLLAGTIKDIVPRYQTMRGYFIDRRFGWDCHGLPVEYEAEQDLGINSKSQIDELGVDVFNERCRGIVLRYTAEWRQMVTRMGRWVDFDREYRTMDPAYMESIWWVFKSLWEKGLVYEGSKILPYCPRCATPLSNFETNQGYADVTDPAITVRFRVEGEPNTYILAWTTTPWTLPSNMALAVGADIRYVRVLDKGTVYYLAADRMSAYYKETDEGLEVTEVPGSALVGLRYEPLFPYFADKKAEGAFRVVAGDFVTTEDGVGVVHMAPGFGEDDYRVAQAEGIPVVCPVDDEGRFTEEVSDYTGREVKEADKDIVARLKGDGSLVHRSTIVHSYPHCWRCDAPLIYRGISTWFVRVEALKERLVEANRAIHWVPDHLREGRFGRWLEGARDWAISRNRYWGTPLPVWRSDDGEEMVCVGSIRELEELTGQRATDLHKHFVDKLEIPSRQGKGMLRRIPEVLDCWFESGAMPYAQAHYPFENREHFEGHFPADFIAEGLDQTRGWFYTLMVLSVALFDKPAFRNVVVNGLVLAEDGRKMSKRLRNYPDPAKMIQQYGADALRLYMIYSPVVRAEDLCFSEDGVKQIMRDILIPWWNAYSFFVTYANIDGWTPCAEKEDSSENVLDRWIRSSLESLAADVSGAMDQYDLQRAVRPFVRFIEDLTNWYIRRSRRRFWKSQDDGDKAQAYRTLHTVLLQLSKIAAPFVPFVSESIYRNLRSDAMPISVHLCDFPVAEGTHRDPELEQEMAEVMTVVRMGRQLRADSNVKVRQPLPVLHVVCRDERKIERIRRLTDLILDELNVKTLAFGRRETSLATLKAKPDFKRMGPRLGNRMKAVAQAVMRLDEEAVDRLASGEGMRLNVGGEEVELAADDIVIERVPREGMVVASEGNLVVVLETELSPELIEEGLVREFVNRIQNMRKTADFEVTQRVCVTTTAEGSLREAVEKFADYVRSETLCVKLVFAPEPPQTAVEWDINGHVCAVAVAPVGEQGPVISEQ